MANGSNTEVLLLGESFGVILLVVGLVLSYLGVGPVGWLLALFGIGCIIIVPVMLGIGVLISKPVQ